MSETKQAVNIYGVLDNELARLHRLVETFVVHESRSSQRDRYGMSSYGHSSGYPSLPDAHHIYARINEIQNILLTAVAGADALVQQKVAELALTGDASPKTAPDNGIPF